MDGYRNTAPGAFSRPRRIIARFIVSLAAGGLVAGAAGAVASSTPGSSPVTALANAALARLPGNIHRLARAGVDAGEAPDATRMHGLDLVFARTPAQEKALDQLLADQQDPKSAQYHHWLTPAEFGRRFGASNAAIRTLSQWLASYGLEAGEVPASRSHLPFSGSKAQVEAAFHTQIHLIDLQGERHYANVSDPLVPAARATPDSGGSRAQRFHSEARREALEGRAAGRTRHRGRGGIGNGIGRACPARMPTTRGRTSIRATSARAISPSSIT